MLILKMHICSNTIDISGSINGISHLLMYNFAHEEHPENYSRLNRLSLLYLKHLPGTSVHQVGIRHI